MENQPPVRLTDVSTLFGQAWSIYKKRIWIFAGILVLPWLVSMIGAFLVGFTAVFLISSSQPVAIILLVFLIVTLVILMVVSQIWGQVALLYAIKDNQELIGIKESYKRSSHKLSSYFWILLLSGLITVGGFMLLIIPGIIFAIWFSFVTFILVSEDLKGMDALLRSKEYVRGRWFDVAWRVLFIGIVSFIISLAFTLILQAIKLPFGEMIIRLFNGLFLTPLATIYLFSVYENLKSVKSGALVSTTKGEKRMLISAGVFPLIFIPLGIIASVIASINAAKMRGEDLKTNSIDTIEQSVTIPKKQ